MAGFVSIFDWYLSMLGRFFYIHIVESSPCNQSYKQLGSFMFTPTSMSYFTFLTGVRIIALIISLK